MHHALRALVALTLVGCGGRGAPATQDAPPAEKASPWVEVDAAAEQVERVTSQARQPMELVGDRGTFTVEVIVAGMSTHHTVALEQSALRVADLPTMLYPLGHVKLDTSTWKVQEHPGWSRTFERGYFRNGVGEPVQLSFDVLSMSPLTGGALDDVGSVARATLTGTLQVESSQVTLTFPIEVERAGEAELVVRSVAPIDIDTAELGRDDRLEAIRRALEVARISPVVKGSFELHLVQAEGELPTFARTPITMKSAVEMKAEVDAHNDRFEAQRRFIGPAHAGAPEMTREAFELAVQEQAKRAAQGVTAEQKRPLVPHRPKTSSQ